MKILNYSLLAAVALGVLSSCGANAKNDKTAVDSISVNADEQAKNNAALGKIEFAEPLFEFGQVKEGEKVNHVFTLKNIGEAPLILSDVKASCGCTQPEFSKNPILPGKSADIQVTFDSKGQIGKQQKIITVYSNASNGLTSVQLRGEVLAAK